MHSKVFDVDPVTGVKKLWHYNSDTDQAVIETIVDATDVVEENKAQFNQMDEHSTWKGDMHRVASIPISLYYDLKAKGIADDPARMKAWLNDPDNRFFRTRPGRV